MPLPVLSAEEVTAAMGAGESDLKWMLSKAEVPLPVQAVTFHFGFISLRMFIGIGESRTEVKASLLADWGLDPATSMEAAGSDRPRSDIGRDRSFSLVTQYCSVLAMVDAQLIGLAMIVGGIAALVLMLYFQWRAARKARLAVARLRLRQRLR